jgi:Ser/Thr protein kinase RdoA (MazF antagonist)
MSLWSEIQDAYGITIITQKKVRDVFCLTTEENGILCMKSYPIPETEVAFIAQVFTHLSVNSFTYSPKLLLTRNQTPWIKIDEVHYMLTNWIEGMQPDFKKRQHYKKAVRLLARFHSAAQNFQAADVPDARVRYNDLGSKIIHYRNILSGYAETENLVLLCDEALERLSHPMVIQAIESEKKAAALVHGDYNYPNLVRDRSRAFHMIDYENTSMNLRMMDLSHILHRNFPWRGKETMRWVEYYNSKRTLSVEDRYLLHTLLLIPYPVVRAIMFKRNLRNFVPTVRTIKNYKHKLNRLL